MVELNIEEVQQASIAPNSTDVPESSTYSESLVTFDFPKSSPDAHACPASRRIEELHIEDLPQSFVAPNSIDLSKNSTYSEPLISLDFPKSSPEAHACPACHKLVELNIDEVQQECVAPNSIDLLQSSTYKEPLGTFDFAKSSPDDHGCPASRRIEELNIEELQQSSLTPNSVDLPKSSTYSEPIMILDFPKYSPDTHARPACHKMAELNIEEVQLASVVPKCADLPESSTYSEPLVTFNFPKSSPDDHGRPACHRMEELHNEEVQQASIAPNFVDLPESSTYSEPLTLFDFPKSSLDAHAHRGGHKMEEINIEKVQQESVPSNSADLPENLTYSEPLISFDLSKSSQDAHVRTGCRRTEELNIEELQQASFASNSVDLPKSSTYWEPVISFDFPKISLDAHGGHLSEDLSSLKINDLLVNNEESFCNQIEMKKTGYHGNTKKNSVDINALTINESGANKAEENFHNQIQERTLSRENSAERNIFKAAEIAERFIKALDKRASVETAAPIESVKDAVSKFGGILDWKERRKHVQLALDKVRKDFPEYQKRLEVAEVDKSKVLQKLSSTRRVIDGLKLSLEKAQNEAVQAQQDSELAKIRLKEIQQGIARKESAAVKAEIELAKVRYATALEDLRSVKDEQEQLRMEHASLITHKVDAETKAHESNAASQEIEKTVEDMTLHLISLKESLTSTHATHIIAQERRINVDLAYQQEKDNWQNELKQVDEEIQKLNAKVAASQDLEFKIEDAYTLLVNLQGEFNAYEEGALAEVSSLRMTLAKTMKELEDMRTIIGKAKHDVKGLWNIAATLRADIENEKADLKTLREKEHRATVIASSLKEDLFKMSCELSVVHERIKAARMPQELQHATNEANRAKAKAQLACDEVAKAREEADRAKAEVKVTQLRLEATSREILAVNASKEITMSYNHRTEIDPQSDGRISNNVTLSVEEYDMVSKRAREAEDHAKKQITNAVKKIEEAKDIEVRTLDKLYQLTKQIDDRRVALRAAQEKAIAAQNEKFIMESELRMRRDKHEQQSKVGQKALVVANVCTDPKKTSSSFDAVESSTSNRKIHGGKLSRSDTIVTGESKSCKSFFPRFIVTIFISRKKARSK